MTRAAFLPSPGDPYVLLNCLKYFPVWENEVDTLYININSDIEYAVIDELIKKLNHPKIKFSHIPYVAGHGTSINYMLEQCVEDHILLIEDDSIIFRPGIVNKYFQFLENGTYDVIGSPRMSCSPYLAEIAKQKFGLNYEGYGDRGPNFWPCFLWTKKSCLLNTSREFNNYGWKKGAEFLGTTLTEDIVGDTFVRASIELRALGCKILEVKQYHAHPADVSFHKKNKMEIFDGNCSYIHFGSLSSGISSYLLDENGRRLKERIKLDIVPDPLQSPLDMATEELERRVAWWTEGYRVGTKEFNYYVSGFSEAYQYAIQNLITLCNLQPANIERWVSIYKELY